MTWFIVNLTLDDVVAGKAIQINDSFDKHWTDASAPQDAAMFTNFPQAENCCLYFSPGAMQIPSVAALVSACGGAACEKPAAKDIILEIGHSNAKERLL